MADIQPLRARIVHHRALAELDGLVLVADQMMRHTQHPLDVQRAGRVVQLPGDAFTLYAGAERAVEISDAGQIDVQPTQQPELPVQVVKLLSQLQASREAAFSLFSWVGEAAG